MAKWKEPRCVKTRTDYDDLCARLKTSCYLAFDDGTNDYATAEEAAAAIRELEAECNQWRVDCEEFRRDMEAAEAKLVECEARLGKAVEALTDIVKDCEAEYPPSHGAIKYFCRTTLAEIEGKKDE